MPNTHNRAERSSSRVDAFLTTHTDFLSHADTTLPPNTECPICLEGLEEHICVKIVGIPGCLHLIGLECLTALLNSRPRDQKLCPLCRAEWLSEENVAGDSFTTRPFNYNTNLSSPISSRHAHSTMSRSYASPRPPTRNPHYHNSFTTDSTPAYSHDMHRAPSTNNTQQYRTTHQSPHHHTTPIPIPIPIPITVPIPRPIPHVHYNTQIHHPSLSLRPFPPSTRHHHLEPTLYDAPRLERARRLGIPRSPTDDFFPRRQSRRSREFDVTFGFWEF